MSLMKNRFYFVLIVFLSAFSCSLAQTTGNDRYRAIVKDNHSFVEFLDTITGKVINKLDVSTNNPYIDLNYRSNSVDHKGDKVYDLERFKLKDVDLGMARFVRNINYSEEYYVEKGLGSYSDVVLYKSRSANYVIVKYNFFLTEGTSLLGQSSVVYIYTAEGALFKQIHGFTTQCQNLCITEDGQFIAYTYGGIADESFERFDTIGYQIMDVQTENVIIDESFIHPVCETLMGCFGNLIMAACDKLNVITFIVYDFENKKKYTKDYPVSVLGKRRGITDFGFSFEVESNGTNVIRTDYYETDFKVEEIK